MMSNELNCPNCGAEVAATGAESRSGIGGESGRITWRDWKQHAKCSACGLRLQRLPRTEHVPLRGWQVEQAK